MKNYWIISGITVVIAVAVAVGVTRHYDKTNQDSAVMMQKQSDAKAATGAIQKTATPTPDAMMHSATPTPDAMKK